MNQKFTNPFLIDFKKIEKQDSDFFSKLGDSEIVRQSLVCKNLLNNFELYQETFIKLFEIRQGGEDFDLKFLENIKQEKELQFYANFDFYCRDSRKDNEIYKEDGS